LHNKPQGCGASVASAAGPFSNKKKVNYTIGNRTRDLPVCSAVPHNFILIVQMALLLAFLPKVVTVLDFVITEKYLLLLL
jgi:hypothetical protein